MTSNRNRGDIPAIPDTPDNIARAIMQAPPKPEWRYLEREQEPEGEADE